MSNPANGTTPGTHITSWDTYLLSVVRLADGRTGTKVADLHTDGAGI